MHEIYANERIQITNGVKPELRDRSRVEFVDLLSESQRTVPVERLDAVDVRLAGCLLVTGYSGTRDRAVHTALSREHEDMNLDIR